MNIQAAIDYDLIEIADPNMAQSRILKASPHLSDIFRPIHYLGSKLRLVTCIQNIIDELDLSGGYTCDLFAGSGTVSKYLSYTRPVLSVDIQEYSRVLCSALLNPSITLAQAEDFVGRSIKSGHLERLTWAINPLVNYEASCVRQALEGNPFSLCELIENGSIYGFEQGFVRLGSTVLNKCFREVIKRLDKINAKKGPEALIVRYYGGLYFSYSQALQLDSLRESISQSSEGFKDILLAALLSTTSEIVNTVGKQFAQPLRPRKSDGTPKNYIGQRVNRDRSIDIIAAYRKWLNRYLTITKSQYDNKIYRMDYRDALDMLNDKVKVVYADPPYTRDHYSRFYHVLETICLRDIPNISTTSINGKTNISRGVYRKDRHQSPFCIKSKSALAFEDLFMKTRKLGASLVLSYSPYEKTGGARPRLLTIDELLLLARRFYTKVSLIPVAEFSHSKLNCSDKNLDIPQNAESFIICQVN